MAVLLLTKIDTRGQAELFGAKRKKMKIKNIFKNKSTMNTENSEKECEVNENTVNEVESAAELTVEEQLQEDLAKEKDKFLRLFAEFENFKKELPKKEWICTKLLIRKFCRSCYQY